MSLEVSGLRKDFKVQRPDALGHDVFTAVDGVDFAVPAGGALAIVGESGSGKTTCARMIAGLERPTAGTIAVDGEAWSHGRLSRAERKRRGRAIQMVFQDPYLSLDPRQSVRACLSECLSLHFDLDREAEERRIVKNCSTSSDSTTASRARGRAG